MQSHETREVATWAERRWTTPWRGMIWSTGREDMSTAYLTREVLLRWIPLESVSRAVVLYGFELELLSERDAVDIELARYTEGALLDDVEEALALLLSDELGRVRELLHDGGRVEGSDEAALVWFLSAASELYEYWNRVSVPTERLFSLLEYLELDERYSDLVYLAPISFWRRVSRSSFRDRLALRLIEVRSLLDISSVPAS